MFNNIGGKLKGLAVVACWLGIAFSVISGLIILSNSASRYNSGGTIISALSTILLGSLFSWIGSLGMYGFGQLIENSDTIASNMANLKALQQRTLAQPTVFTQPQATHVEENPVSPKQSAQPGEGLVCPVDRSAATISCPNCGLEQRSSRHVCFRCGAAFTDAKPADGMGNPASAQASPPQEQSAESGEA